MPLDLALAAELERVAAPPTIPPVAIEQPWRSNAAQHAEQLSDRRIGRARQQQTEWREQVASVRDRLVALVESTWDDHLTPVLDEQILHAERRAEERATKVASASKDIERVQKALQRRDPSLADVHRRATRVVLDLQRELIEDLLDFALFLRSIRSSVVPDTETSPIFTTSDELDAFLRSALSA